MVTFDMTKIEQISPSQYFQQPEPGGDKPNWTPIEVAMIKDLNSEQDRFKEIGRINTAIMTGKSTGTQVQRDARHKGTSSPKSPVDNIYHNKFEETTPRMGNPHPKNEQHQGS